jgi:hypothetical protein
VAAAFGHDVGDIRSAHLDCAHAALRGARRVDAASFTVDAAGPIAEVGDVK